MWRISVLLPQPLPPMMMNTSATPNGEIEIVLDDILAERHGQIADDDVIVAVIGRSPRLLRHRGHCRQS